MSDYYQQPSPEWENNDAFASGPTNKSRGVAALLAIFLGSLGIQYFYLGKPVAGIIALLGTWGITICTCGFGGIVGIIWLIQGILMFCMTNRDFQRKYVDTTSTFPLF